MRHLLKAVALTAICALSAWSSRAQTVVTPLRAPANLTAIRTETGAIALHRTDNSTSPSQQSSTDDPRLGANSQYRVRALASGINAPFSDAASVTLPTPGARSVPTPTPKPKPTATPVPLRAPDPVRVNDSGVNGPSGIVKTIVVLATDTNTTETGYSFERKMGARSAYAVVAINNTAKSPDPSVFVEPVGLANSVRPNTVYFYRVRAFRTQGTTTTSTTYGPYSREVSGKFTLSAPTLKLNGVGTAYADFQLDVPKPGSSSRFMLQRVSVNGKAVTVPPRNFGSSLVDREGTHYLVSDRGLAANTKYVYRAIDTSGEVPPSNLVTFTTQRAELGSGPSDLSLQGRGGFGGFGGPTYGITITWSDGTAKGETGYVVERYIAIGGGNTISKVIATVPGSDASDFTFQAEDGDTSFAGRYFYRVRAYYKDPNTGLTSYGPWSEYVFYDVNGVIFT